MSDLHPNARGHRASICVRACDGIPDVVLEDPEYSVKAELDSLDKIIETSAQLLQQRDKLIAALERIEKYGAQGFNGDFTQAQIAKDALAEFRGN